MGSFIQWEDNFSVGNEELDKQHKKLIEMIKTFHTNISINTKSAMKEAIDSLIKYTDYHFKSEEKIMKNKNYHDLETHKQIHAQFVKEVVDIKQKFDNNEMILPTEISSMLRHWLINHILNEDQKYKDSII